MFLGKFIIFKNCEINIYWKDLNCVVVFLISFRLVLI